MSIKAIPVSEFDQGVVSGPYGMVGPYLNPRTMRRARQFRRRVRRMELIKAVVLAALTILITVACMSVFGWAAAKFAMGY